MIIECEQHHLRFNTGERCPECVTGRHTPVDLLLQASDAETPNAVRVLIKAAALYASGPVPPEYRDAVAAAVRVVFQNACYAECNEYVLRELGLMPQLQRRTITRRKIV